MSDRLPRNMTDEETARNCRREMRFDILECGPSLDGPGAILANPCEEELRLPTDLLESMSARFQARLEMEMDSDPRPVDEQLDEVEDPAANTLWLGGWA